MSSTDMPPFVPYTIAEKVADEDGHFIVKVRCIGAYDNLTEARASRDRIIAESPDPAGYDGEQDYSWIRRGKPPKVYRYFVEPLST